MISCANVVAYYREPEISSLAHGQARAHTKILWPSQQVYS